MSRTKAIILGICTAWPFLYMILFMCMVFGMVMGGFFDAGGSSSAMPLSFLVIFPLHFLTMIEIVALLVIYIVFLFKTDRITQDMKAIWAIVLLLGGLIAMPIFWYLYIWKEPSRNTPEASE